MSIDIYLGTKSDAEYLKTMKNPNPEKYKTGSVKNLAST